MTKNNKKPIQEDIKKKILICIQMEDRYLTGKKMPLPAGEYSFKIVGKNIKEKLQLENNPIKTAKLRQFGTVLKLQRQKIWEKKILTYTRIQNMSSIFQQKEKNSKQQKNKIRIRKYKKLVKSYQILNGYGINNK